MNGVDLDEYSNASVRRCISYVPQNVELFSKTIFENIRISRPEATLDQVREAAKKADAHEFIRKLPLQYNTYLEEAGNGLSGGEKQRIALARAFLKDSSLYIFDESTSSLDFGTENTIFDMIYNQLADRSMLIVAHRLSTIREADVIPRSLRRLPAYAALPTCKLDVTSLTPYEAACAIAASVGRASSRRVPGLSGAGESWHGA